MEARDTMPRHQVAARDHSARAPQRRCASSVRHAPRHVVARARPRVSHDQDRPYTAPRSWARPRASPWPLPAIADPAGRADPGNTGPGSTVPRDPCPGERPERASALRAARPSHAVSSPASGSQRGIRCCQAPRLIRVQRLPLPLAQPGIECDKGQPSRSARPAGPLAQPARSAMSESSGRQALAAGDEHRAHHN